MDTEPVLGLIYTKKNRKSKSNLGKSR